MFCSFIQLKLKRNYLVWCFVWTESALSLTVDVYKTVLGHFGHGHFGLGRFSPDISATDISATENAKGGRFGQNHKLWVGDGIKYYMKWF